MSELEPNYTDHVLSTTYRVIVDNGGEFGLSLLVGGTWLTGTAVGPRAWFEQLAKLLDDSNAGDLGPLMRTAGQQLYPAPVEIEAGVVEAFDDEGQRPTGFLHMRDATIIGPNGERVPQEGGLVRVRLSDVGAWLIGTLGPPGYKSPPPAV